MLGLLVAIYTAAVQGDGRRSPRLVAAGIAVLGVGWLLAADLRPFSAAGWVLFRLAAAVAVINVQAGVTAHMLERRPEQARDTLEELATVAREAGLDVKLQVAAPPAELPAAVAQAAYRILREAVTNAIRHAGPARLTVSVRHRPGELELVVSDDGRGRTGDSRGAGRGIVGMAERAGLLGGELVAGPRPAGGFQVRARLPLPPGPKTAP